MSDESGRREFVTKAGALGALGALAALSGDAAAQPRTANVSAATAKRAQLPARKFAAFYNDLVALVDPDAENEGTSVADVLKQHGLEMRLPPRVQQALDVQLNTPAGKLGPGTLAASECGACGVCAICTACAEVNAGAVGAAAAALYALA